MWLGPVLWAGRHCALSACWRRTRPDGLVWPAGPAVSLCGVLAFQANWWRLVSLWWVVSLAPGRKNGLLKGALFPSEFPHEQEYPPEAGWWGRQA